MLLLVRGEVRSVTPRARDLGEDVRDRRDAGGGRARRGRRRCSASRPSTTRRRRSRRASLRDLAGAALAGAARIGDPLPPSLRVRNRPAAAPRRHHRRPPAAHAGGAPPSRATGWRTRSCCCCRSRCCGTAPRSPPPAGPRRCRRPGELVARYIARSAVRAHRRAAAGAGRDRRRPRVPPSRCSACCRATSAPARRRSRWRVLLRALEAGGQAALMAPTEVLAVQHMLTAERLLDGPRRRALPAHRRRAEEGARRPPAAHRGRRAADRDRHARAAVRRVQPPAGGRDRRAAPVRGRPARGARRRRDAARAAHDGDADPALAGADAVRRPRRDGAGRAAARPLRRCAPRNVPESKREDGYRWIVEQVQAGRQAYIVCPLVEGSVAVEARAAEAEATRLARRPAEGGHRSTSCTGR